MAESEKKKPSSKPDKDNIGWRYCLTMMLLCFTMGLLSHSLWVQYMDSRYARVWEADKIRTLDRCSRLTKLAIAVTSTGRPGSPEVQAWLRSQTAESKVPPELRQDYADWQILNATNAALAQLEYFELKDRLPESDPFREDFESFGEIIDEIYEEAVEPVRSK